MMTVDLFADSCAMVHVAGKGYRDCLKMLDGNGSDASAAGSHRLVAAGWGSAVLRFNKPGATYQVHASPLLGRGQELEPSAQLRAKVVLMLKEAKPTNGEVKWLEGPLRRVGGIDDMPVHEVVGHQDAVGIARFRHRWGGAPVGTVGCCVCLHTPPFPAPKAVPFTSATFSTTRRRRGRG